MSDLTSKIIVLFFLVAHLHIVASTNNTTQFDNFTIEWDDFSILTCAVPMTINVSLFTCFPSPNYTQVDDMSCLVETSIDFDDSVCDITTTAPLYTTSGLVTTAKQQTTMVTNTVIQTQTSRAMAGGTTLSTRATTRGSATNTATNGSTTTTTRATTQGSATNTTTNGSSTTNTTTHSSATNRTTNAPSTTTTSLSGVNPTTTTAVNIYTCSNDYIGDYCNISSDACAMSQPCLNAATCFPNDTLPYGYTCECQAGYIGYNCEYDERSCQENTCWNNGTCIAVNTTIPSYNGSNFKCECVQGYDGVYCELKIDLCDNITCENRGICENVQLTWECLCLDATLYYGDYCQFKTNKLKIREILSKSFAAVAIGAIITTCTFVVVMDILKYAFHIDPVEYDRESYRKRREERRRARQPVRNDHPRIALRFQYVS